MFCPNFSNKQVKKEFTQLSSIVGEDLAYYYWDKHQGELFDIVEDVNRKYFTSQNVSSVVEVTNEMKPWKTAPNKVNLTIQLRIKGDEEKGYFEVVKDNEDGYYSVHFKTADFVNNPFTQEEKDALFKAIVDAVPEGSKISTWGSLTKGGVIGLNRLTKYGTEIVGERQASDKDGNNITIPIVQKNSSDEINSAAAPKSVDSVYKRTKVFTASQWAMSNRIANVLSEIYPELSVEYVDSLREGLLGVADLNAMRILIDYANQKLDTLPHEYAHYYIAMFRNSELVNEGINEFGSEEALVQAIGEQVITQDGKALNWWKNFVLKIKSILNKNKYGKQALLSELTDAFLNRRELGIRQEVYGQYHQEVKTGTVEDIRMALRDAAKNITFDEKSHTYTDTVSGNQLQPTTSLKHSLGFDSYDKANEDKLQADLTERAARLGTEIHAVFEAMWFNNFNPDSFPGFSKKAADHVAAIVKRFKDQYDIVASEALLGDAENKVAGTADLILQDKKTGEIVLADFKTKMTMLNGKFENEKGKKLHGFKFVNSTKFSPKSSRDGYDFQLTVYEHMIDEVLKPFGKKVGKRVIIPICYSYTKTDGITGVFTSKEFGSDEDYNKKVESDGYAEIVKKKETDNVVKHKVFNEPYTEEEKGQQEAVSDLSALVDKIIKKLKTQSELLSKKSRTATVAKEAQHLAEQIQTLQEIDGILMYVKFADKTLERLEKQINYRIKMGDDVQWSLETLTDYKNVAQSYRLLQTIPTMLSQFGEEFNASTIKEINKFCEAASTRINKIVGAYDTYGKKLYLDMITPYTKNIEYNLVQAARTQYIKDNPKKADETADQFEERLSKYAQKWKEEHQHEIEFQTKQWLNLQTQIADSGFECNGIAAMIGSVYETKDPFVAAMVKMYDERMNLVQKQLISYRAKVSRILKAYREKYHLGNFSNFKEVFDDLIEIKDGECYLVSPISTEFITAEKKAHYEIFNDGEKTWEQKRAAYKDWLDTNNPISDFTAFDSDLSKEAVNIMADAKEEEKKAVNNNLKKNRKDRDSWYKLYKAGKITSYQKDCLEQAEFNLEQKYRKPNQNTFKNEKYKALKALPESDPKRQLYELLSEIMCSMDEGLPKSLKLNWRLPGIMKRGMEIRNSDGTISAITDFASRNILSFADDDVRGTFVNDDGVRVNTIPLFYRPSKKITPENQSFDLPTMFGRWMESALEWQQKNEMEAYVLQTQAVLSTRLTETKRKSLLRNNSGNVSEHKSNTERQFAMWVDQVFYGNKLFELGKIHGKFSDKTYDIGKIVKSFIALASNNAMSLNWVAGLTNVVTGEINQVEEVFANEYGIDPKSYNRASGIFLKNCTGIAQDFYKASPDNVLNKLADWFGINEGDSNMTLSGVLRRGIDSYTYAPMSVGDVAMKYRFMIGMLINMQAKDKDGNVLGSMYDFIKFNENNELVVDDKVANFSESDQNEFALKLRRLIISIHGNMSSQRSLVGAERVWYGKMGLALRRFIEPNTERRFAEKHFDPFLNATRVGFSRYGAKWLFVTNPCISTAANWIANNLFRVKERKIEAQRWQDLESVEKKAIIRFGIEIGAMTLLYLTSMIIGHFVDDDDEKQDDKFLYLCKYLSYRVYTDLSFFYLPTSFTKILKDPFPVISYFNKIIGVWMQLLSPFEEYTNGSHVFDNKFLDKSMKVIPGLKQIGRYQNIKREIEYFVKGN